MGPASSAVAAAGPVQIIIPIFGAAEALERCLDSVLEHTDLDRHGLTLVADGPQQDAVEASLTRTAARAGATVLRLPVRRGFPAAANLGISTAPAADRDVVLLNSDTRVTPGWVEKLRAAAHSGARVASATPFSNAATICSLPRWLESNALPTGWTEVDLGALVERVSTRAYPRLPTGVGVCLYLKRAAIREIGLFDADAFGLGYGEENDWCARASRAGWHHVLDDATFIFHEGQGSFGASHPARTRTAHRIMRRRYPEYLPAVARFVDTDPLHPLRARVIAGLMPPMAPRSAAGARSPLAPERVLHVVHGWPPWNHAGTEWYAAWLARWQAPQRQVAAYARIADPARALGHAVELLDHGVRVRLVVNNFTQRDPLARNALRNRRLERDFGALLDDFRPDLVHIHHLAGHSMRLPGVIRRRNIPIVLQLQDWWLLCARANLLDARRRLCSGPGLGKCAACLPLTRRFPAPLWNRLLYLERRRLMRSALDAASALVTGSEFLAASFRALAPRAPIDDRLEVLPYGVPEAAHRRPARPAVTWPLRCATIGSLLPHKGTHLAVAAFRDLDPAHARLEVWGDATADPAYVRELRALAGPAVAFRGSFPERAKPELYANLDLLIVPSLGLESFGLVAYEAAAAGVPVVASARGALPELFATTASRPAGATFDPDDPDALRLLLAALVADPATVDRWRAALPAVKDARDHAEEVESVYRRVLERDRTDTAGSEPPS